MCATAACRPLAPAPAQDYAELVHTLIAQFSEVCVKGGDLLNNTRG